MSEQAKAFVIQWFLDCDLDDGTEVMKEIEKQRPDIVHRDPNIEIDPGEDETVQLVGQRLHPSPLNSARSSISGWDSPLLQFSAPKYYCVENEETVTLEVLRLSGLDQVCEVRYFTEDGSAVAGVNYQPQDGRLRFNVGDVQQNIKIPLIDDSSWCGVLEFRVELDRTKAVNCEISEHNTSARVQRLDDDCFPTNKYAKEIRHNEIAKVSSILLFFEYFKLNLSDPKVSRGTWKVMLLGQIMNLFLIVRLYAGVILVDHVLAPTDDSSANDMMITSKSNMLVVLIVAGVLMMLLSHMGSIRKYSWGVVGNARMHLSLGIANAFLHRDQSTNGSINEAILLEAMTHDTETIIKVGYTSFIRLFQLVGEIIMSMLFQLSAILASESGGLLTLGLIAVFPILMGFLIWARLETTRTAIQQRRSVDQQLAADVNDMVSKFSLIRDFQMKSWVMDRHAEDIGRVSKSDRHLSEVLEHNRYLIKWLTILTTSVFLFFGGLTVIQGGLRLGVFLSCMKVFVSMSATWARVYTEILQTYGSTGALERIVRFMNMPTDADQHMYWARMQRHLTIEAAQQKGAAAKTFDSLPIQISNLKVVLKTHLTSKQLWDMETKLEFSKLTIKQGQFVCLIGPHGQGKSTLLRLLGGAQLPSMQGGLDQCLWFIPSHLHVLHVGSEPLFYRGNLYNNLTYGQPIGHPDAELDRVRRVCRRVGVPEELIARIDPEAPSDAKWAATLHASALVLLVVARALIANPDVLCIHKPVAHVNLALGRRIIDTLRDFVDKRGLEASHNESSYNAVKTSRPRTCIITSTTAHALEVADEIYKVSSEGIHLVDTTTEAVRLDDMC